MLNIENQTFFLTPNHMLKKFYKMEKLLITTSSFGKYDPTVFERMQKEGLEPVLNPYKRKLTKEEVIDLLKDIKYLIAGLEPLDEEVLSSTDTLEIISRCGVGMENLDLDYAKKRSIVVKNTPFGPTEAVSELAIGLMLNLLRHVSISDRNIRSGTWQKTMGSLLSRKIIGLIGFGNIAKDLYKKLTGFDCKFLVYDPYYKEDSSYKVEVSELDDLLKQSDIVSLHLPLTDETKDLINSEKLSLMKEDSIIINASRGGIVDESALYDALKSNKIKGAAIDTFIKEPYSGNLTDLDNVIVTPHIGSYAIESRIYQENKSLDNILEHLGRNA